MEGRQKVIVSRQPESKRNGSRKPRNLVSTIVIGLAVVGLLAGVGYGVLFVSSLFSITSEISNLKDDPPQKVAQTMPIEDPQQKVAPPPVQPDKPAEPKTVAAATSAQEEPAVEEIIEAGTSEDVEENDLEDDPEEMRISLEREVGLLKAALPDNMMVPSERTNMEAEALMADGQEQATLQALIDKGEATQSDKERYFDMISKQLEDEVEIINHCNQMVANSNNNADHSNNLCADISRDGGKRIEEIETRMEELRQQLL